MSLNKIMYDLLQRIKLGEIINCSTIDIANESDYDFFSVQVAFDKIEMYGLAKFKEIGLGEKEIIGLTEKGHRFLKGM